MRMLRTFTKTNNTTNQSEFVAKTRVLSANNNNDDDDDDDDNDDDDDDNNNNNKN